MGRPQVRPGLVVAVRPPPQVLCVAATKLRGEVFVRFGPEAGGPGGVHGSIYEKFHAEVQGLGRAVAAPRLQFETARRAPGVFICAVRVVHSTAPARWRRAGFCCFVSSLSYSSGRDGAYRRESIDSEDAVTGLCDTYGVCGIWREAG